MDNTERIPNDMFFALVANRNLNRCAGTQWHRVRLLTVRLPGPDVIITSRRDNHAISTKGNRQDAVWEFTGNSFRSTRRMRTGILHCHESRFRVPPDQASIIARTGQQATVTSPSQAAHRPLVIGQRQQDAATVRTAQIQITGAIPCGDLFSVWAKGNRCHPVRMTVLCGKPLCHSLSSRLSRLAPAHPTPRSFGPD